MGGKVTIPPAPRLEMIKAPPLPADASAPWKAKHKKALNTALRPLLERSAEDKKKKVLPLGPKGVPLPPKANVSMPKVPKFTLMRKETDVNRFK